MITAHQKYFLVLILVAGACAYGLYYFWSEVEGQSVPEQSISQIRNHSDLGDKDKNFVPVSPPRASGVRGRRGIIQEIFPAGIAVRPTDSFAFEGEALTVRLIPSTSYVLVSIPTASHGGDGGEESVMRSSLDAGELRAGDDIFIISFRDITASTTFSALRIEKIVTP